jgi:hypothetical protein
MGVVICGIGGLVVAHVGRRLAILMNRKVRSKDILSLSLQESFLRQFRFRFPF